MNELDMDLEAHEDHEGGGFSPLSFMLGLAVGVVATVVFATYAQDKFTVVTRKTRQIGDKAGETATNVGQKVSETAQTVAKKARDQYANVSSKAKDQIDGMADRGKELINS